MNVGISRMLYPNPTLKKCKKKTIKLLQLLFNLINPWRKKIDILTHAKYVYFPNLWVVIIP